MFKFEDIEVGDTVTIRRKTPFHKDTEITGEVRDVSRGPWVLDVYLHGVNSPFCADLSTILVDIQKNPVDFPEVGRPIKMWNRLMKEDTTCYGFWDGRKYSGTNFMDGQIATFNWSERSSAFKNIRWEYIDEKN